MTDGLPVGSLGLTHHLDSGAADARRSDPTSRASADRCAPRRRGGLDDTRGHQGGRRRRRVHRCRPCRGVAALGCRRRGGRGLRNSSRRPQGRVRVAPEMPTTSTRCSPTRGRRRPYRDPRSSPRPAGATSSPPASVVREAACVDFGRCCGLGFPPTPPARCTRCVSTCGSIRCSTRRARAWRRARSGRRGSSPVTTSRTGCCSDRLELATGAR